MRRNTSGLGKKDAPPSIAVYTGDGHKKQTQNIASSTRSRCLTWTKFPGNPVLDLNSNSFRDPKVFWHKPTSRWIMATVLADVRKVRLFSSADLKSWEKLSDFGPAGSVQGVWECPELFEAPVEGGAPGESRWVLKVDVNAGALFGGSGGQYFVGRFDGKEFRPRAKPEYYAALDRLRQGLLRFAKLGRRPHRRPAGLDRLDEQLAICE